MPRETYKEFIDRKLTAIDDHIVNGGSNIQITEILTNGIVSTDSAYAVASLTGTIEDDDIVLVRVRDTVDNVDYSAVWGVQGSQIGSGKNFGVKLHPAGDTVNVRLTDTTVEVNNYSGTYYYIYADVIAVKPENELFKFN